MADKIRKTTLAESPDASAVLTEIKPHEVSIVDMPANGEPFVVIKRGEKIMSKEANEKLDHSVVPRSVMKVIDNRLRGVQSMVSQIQDVVKRVPTSEDGNNETAPPALVSLVKSTSAELRSLQSPTITNVRKRGTAESVLSLQDLTKRDEELVDIEKVNAISYLMRDQYVNVSNSISEWLTTYVEGVEHDDDGPILIPGDLNDGIEESSSKLEKLAETYPASENEEEPDVEAEVNKLRGEIQVLKDTLKSAKAQTKVEVMVGKKGSKMAADRLNSLKSVSSGVSGAADELSKIIKELEDDGDDDMSSDTEKKQSDATTTTKATTQDKPSEKVTNEQLMEAMRKYASDSDARFTKLEAEVAKVKESSDSANSEIEKIHRLRGDSRTTDTDETVKTQKGQENPSSFHNLLGLPVSK